MAGNITFTIIKPDAISRNLIGDILKIINQAGFNIRALKMTQLTRSYAEGFYAIHRNKPFFNDLIDYMTSGPIVVAILEKENAVEDFRKLIGSTNPANAEAGTIRKLYALNVTQNAIHGSDSDENAIIESAYFFSAIEQY